MSEPMMFTNKNYQLVKITNVLIRKNIHIIRLQKDHYTKIKKAMGPIEYSGETELFVKNLEEFTNAVITHYEKNQFKLDKIDCNYHPIVNSRGWVHDMEVNTLYFTR